MSTNTYAKKKFKGMSKIKTRLFKTDPCRVSRSIALIVLISEGCLSCFHSNGSQLGTALLNGFKEETEKPDKPNKVLKNDDESSVSGYFFMDIGTG